MTESHIKANVLLGIGALPGVRVFNCPTGEGWQGQIVHRDRDTVTLANPRRIRFGLVEGGSDLIGWRSTIITPEMIGRPVAIFTAIEVKAARGRVGDHQQKFLNAVQAAGGLAGVVRSPDQAMAIVQVQQDSP